MPWSRSNLIATFANPSAADNWVTGLPNNVVSLEVTFPSLSVSPVPGQNVLSAEFFDGINSLGLDTESWYQSDDCNASIFDPNPQC